MTGAICGINGSASTFGGAFGLDFDFGVATAVNVCVLDTLGAAVIGSAFGSRTGQSRRISRSNEATS